MRRCPSKSNLCFNYVSTGSLHKDNIWTRLPRRGDSPIQALPHHGGSILRTQSRSRLSHELHARHLDDTTLLNDIPFHPEEEAQQEHDPIDARSDASADPNLLFTWDNEQSLLWDLMEEGYVVPLAQLLFPSARHCQLTALFLLRLPDPD